MSQRAIYRSIKLTNDPNVGPKSIITTVGQLWSRSYASELVTGILDNNLGLCQQGGQGSLVTGAVVAMIIMTLVILYGFQMRKTATYKNKIFLFSVMLCKLQGHKHTVQNHHFLSKNSTLTSRENCRFFWDEKLVKMLWFWTY